MNTRLVQSVAAAVLAVPLMAVEWCAGEAMVVSPDRGDGVYATGETVRWTVAWNGESAPPVSRYVVKSNGLKEVGRGELAFGGGRVAKLETKFDSPGTVLVEVRWEPEGAANRASGGAVADPEKVLAPATEPDDFDAFWKGKLEELARVPANVRLERADGGRAGVDYRKVTMDNVRGTKVRGQVARPERGEKFPALLIVQWAGVYPLQKAWVTDRATEGWLALNILPHDLPIDEPESYYKEQFEGPLKNYWAIGNDDRDTSYYLRMYLSCSRALEYLRSRPDWDGKTLVVMGTSQGGQQALAVAGMHPGAVTAVLALVPAACEMLGPADGRASGFPHWYDQVHGKDPRRVREASRYYDPVNFARRITCPVLIGAGLRDDVTPPSSVLAAANVVKGPKELVILPVSGHQDERGSQGAYNRRCYEVWLPALREGRGAPVGREGASAGR